MYGNTPGWKDLDLNGIGYFTQMRIKDNSGSSGAGNGGNISPEGSPEYALISKSYAVGGTGTREGEDTDNAKYYYEFIKYLTGSTNLMDNLNIIYGGDAFEDFNNGK